MTRRKETSPPRAIAPGDVVAAFSETLGSWTAAQVTDLDPEWRTAGVLEEARERIRYRQPTAGVRRDRRVQGW
ncbi:hypothetical protein [Dactylosporangium sp. NPDC005555]|uniref:hypothetical protein n=1 Tax=Dactylosporangium sp. NPDC005555 TaxID=3154889 RepID=UPI00339EEF8D